MASILSEDELELVSKNYLSKAARPSLGELELVVQQINRMAVTASLFNLILGGLVDVIGIDQTTGQLKIKRVRGVKLE